MYRRFYLHALRNDLPGGQLDVVSRCCDFILIFAWVMGGCSGCVGSDCESPPKGVSIRVSGMLGHSFLIETLRATAAGRAVVMVTCELGPPPEGGVSVSQLPTVSASISARNKGALLFLGNTKEGK